MGEELAATPFAFADHGVGGDGRRHVSATLIASRRTGYTASAVVERGPGRDHAAPAAHSCPVLARRVEPQHADLAAVGSERAGDEPHHGGLARAVRSQQHGHRPGGDAQPEPLDGDDRPEGAPDLVERDHHRAASHRSLIGTGGAAVKR